MSVLTLYQIILNTMYYLFPQYMAIGMNVCSGPLRKYISAVCYKFFLHKDEHTFQRIPSPGGPFRP